MIDADNLLREFNQVHVRDLGQATRLRSCHVLGFGLGAVGGFAVPALVRLGGGATLVDRDLFERANLGRHYLSDPALIGQYKATALAAELRRTTPAIQEIRSLVADIRRLTRSQFEELFVGKSLVVAATGETELDRTLGAWARFFRIPILFPSMWAGEGEVLGDLHVDAWHRPTRRRSACFECLHRPRPAEPHPAEAQPGSVADVMRVAAVTAEVAVALLTESQATTSLRRGLDTGVNYFLIQRWPPSVRPVVTMARRDCAVCSNIATAERSAPATLDLGSPRDWIIGAGLASVVLWHQLIPGFDAATTVTFIGLAGLWWRGRLPSYLELSTRVRRWLNGR